MFSSDCISEHLELSKFTVKTAALQSSADNFDTMLWYPWSDKALTKREGNVLTNICLCIPEASKTSLSCSMFYLQKMLNVQISMFCNAK